MQQTSTQRGAFVISLDFELHWGVFDHVSPPNSPYVRNLLGEWQSVPAMLSVFKEKEIAATWATVGLLFAGTREEQERFRPQVMPEYRNSRLNPYLVPVGENESEDPIHFAASLIHQVRQTPRQEISTHTFSHYYCLEDGSTPAAFREDMHSAVAIAKQYDLPLESIVLPRNQVNPAYFPILRALGIRTYRGTESGWMYTAGDSAAANRRSARISRLLDSYTNISGPNLTQWTDCVQADGMVNIPSSRFLRPYSRKAASAEGLRLRRIAKGIEEAAETKSIYHLWWHPHNFGVNLAENIAFLRRILDVVARYRDSHGLQSLTMRDVGRASLEAF